MLSTWLGLLGSKLIDEMVVVVEEVSTFSLLLMGFSLNTDFISTMVVIVGSITCTDELVSIFRVLIAFRVDDLVFTSVSGTTVFGISWENAGSADE